MPCMYSMAPAQGVVYYGVLLVSFASRKTVLTQTMVCMTCLIFGEGLNTLYHTNS